MDLTAKVEAIEKRLAALEEKVSKQPDVDQIAETLADRLKSSMRKIKTASNEEEFRFWRTTLGSVVASHLPTMTVSQMKELIKKIKEGAVEIKFIDCQK